MKLQDLFEAVDTTSENSDNIKGMKSSIDAIAKILFGTTAGPVKDAKRSKDPIFYGVAHKKSVFTDPTGKVVHLTFDNSTDSGEFEINSLVPLRIERGGPQDTKITALYRKMGVRSKKKTNYIAHGDLILLREVHLGHEIDEATIKFVRALARILNGQSEEEVKASVEEPKKEAKKKE